MAEGAGERLPRVSVGSKGQSKGEQVGVGSSPLSVGHSVGHSVDSMVGKGVSSALVSIKRSGKVENEFIVFVFE